MRRLLPRRWSSQLLRKPSSPRPAGRRASLRPRQSRRADPPQAVAKAAVASWNPRLPPSFVAGYSLFPIPYSLVRRRAAAAVVESRRPDLPQPLRQCLRGGGVVGLRHVARLVEQDPGVALLLRIVDERVVPDGARVRATPLPRPQRSRGGGPHGFVALRCLGRGENTSQRTPLDVLLQQLATGPGLLLIVLPRVRQRVAPHRSLGVNVVAIPGESPGVVHVLHLEEQGARGHG